MMAWRSNPLVFEEGCYTQNKTLTWLEHVIWMRSRGPWWRFFVIMVSTTNLPERAVGIINFGQLDNWNTECNYYLGEISLWGQGVAGEALSQAIKWLRLHGYCKLHTTMKDTNARATGVLEKLGFRKAGKARVGESVWEIQWEEIDGSQEYTSGRKLFLPIEEIYK